MPKKDKKINGNFNFAQLIGFLVVGCFCIFFVNFIYQAVTTETVDSTKQLCPTHNTYHDINENVDDEIWCNNCKTWHAPNEESRTPNIR